MYDRNGNFVCDLCGDPIMEAYHHARKERVDYCYRCFDRLHNLAYLQWAAQGNVSERERIEKVNWWTDDEWELRA